MRFVDIKVVHSLSPEEWHAVDSFKKQVRRVLILLRELGLGDLVGRYQKKSDGTYEGAMSIPPDETLRHLYFEFRQLYAEKDRNNFRRVADIIGRRCPDTRLRAFLGDLKSGARSELVESEFFKIGNRNLTGKQLVDAWFNADLTHSDIQRQKQVDDLNRQLSVDGVRSLLFLTVYDAILTARNLYFVINDFTPETMKVRVPAKYFRSNHAGELL